MADWNSMVGELGRLLEDVQHPSGRELARSAGVSPSTVANWLEGGRFPQQLSQWLAVIRRLSDKLGPEHPQLDEIGWRQAYQAEALRRAGGATAMRAAQARSALAQLPSTGGRSRFEGATADAFDVYDKIAQDRLRRSGLGFVSLALPRPRLPEGHLRGRSAEVARLRSAIEDRITSDRPGRPGVWVLTGPGGSGKTTVALEVANWITGAGLVRRERVWWVTGGADLEAALEAVAHAAGALPGDFSGADAADVLWRHLDDQREPWLLALDNIDNPDVLVRHERGLAEGVGWLRAPEGPGTVLVTSRARNRRAWPIWVQPLPVSVLDVRNAALILQDLAPHAGDGPEAQSLARALGRLPLALWLAGSYLAMAANDDWPDPGAPTTFADYRRMLDARFREFAVDRDPASSEPERKRRTLTLTYELSLDLLDRQGNGHARPLLRLLSCFGAAPIPHLMLLDPVQLATSPLLAGATFADLRNALQGLQDTGLSDVTHHDGPNHKLQRRITLHPVIRRSMRAHPEVASQRPRYRELIVRLLSTAIAGLEEDDPTQWPRWRALAPHASAALWLLDGRPPVREVIEATAPVLRVARYRVLAGLYAEAVHDATQAAAARRKFLGDLHPATVESRIVLAWTLYHATLNTQAESAYREVIDDCARRPAHLGQHLLTARSELAQVLYELGRYAEAEEHLKAVLRSRLPDQVTIRRARHNRAKIRHRLGQFEDAVRELAGLLDAYRAQSRLSDYHALYCGTDLARVLRDTGQLDDADAVCNEVLRRCHEVYPPGHPALLMARHELARIARDRGNLARAESEFRRIWRINAGRYGVQHPVALANQHELATVLHLRGEVAASIQHFSEVLAANRRRLGDDHPDTRICRDNLDRARADRLVVADMGLPDLSALSLADALLLRVDPADAAVRRLREHLLAPRISRGSGGPPGGYSGGGFGWAPDNLSRTVDYRSAALRARKPPASHPSDKPGIALAELRSGWRSAHMETLETVAGGKVTSATIDTLHAWQRDSRLAAIALVVAESGRHPAAVGPLPDLAEGLDLLGAAARTAPDAVYRLLASPRVGRWVSHTVRRLDGDLDSTAVPVWADTGFLHSIAAAAGMLAGHSFTCSVPAPAGVIFLPGWGEVAVGADETGVAKVTSSPEGTTVGNLLATVRVGGSADWYPLSTLRTSAGGVEFSVDFEDFGPYRGITDEEPVSAGDWQKLLDSSWRLLVRLDEQHAAALGTAFQAITPQPARTDTRLLNFSSSDAFGGAVICRPAKPEELAEALVHEFRHMQLDGLLNVMDLYENDDADLFCAPWRDDPRPLSALFHGVFAYFGVAAFHHRLLGDSDAKAAAFDLAYWRAQAWDAFQVLRKSPQLTSLGKLFVEVMERSADPWRTAEVPKRISELAADAVAYQRSRWRAHHLRARPTAVADLVRAVTNSTAFRSRPGLGSTVRRGSTATGLDSGTPLLRAIAVGQDLPDRPDTDLAAAEAAWVRDDYAVSLCDELMGREGALPDLWACLGMALRQTEPEAARLLLTNVELAMAAYTHVRRKAGAVCTPSSFVLSLGATGLTPNPPMYSPWA